MQDLLIFISWQISRKGENVVKSYYSFYPIAVGANINSDLGSRVNYVFRC